MRLSWGCDARGAISFDDDQADLETAPVHLRIRGSDASSLPNALFFNCKSVLSRDRDVGLSHKASLITAVPFSSGIGTTMYIGKLGAMSYELPDSVFHSTA